MKKTILLVAGEISADMHGAQILADLKKLDPDIQAWGIGGACLRKEGMEILYDTDKMATLGITEVLQKYLFFRRVFKEILERCNKEPPDVLLLIDYPGFNLPLAKEAHSLGLKVIYYICPQIWAWKTSRRKKMIRHLQRLLVIFPFEVDIFNRTSLPVHFVGHPLLEETRQVLAEPDAILPWPGSLRVALLPGSRLQEIDRNLPLMLETSRRILRERPEAGFIIASPSHQITSHVEKFIPQEKFIVITHKTRQVLKQARAAMVASGTATLETALMGCPMIILYKTAMLTYLLGKLLVKIPNIGMVNILAGKEICPEFIQHQAQPISMASAFLPLLYDSNEYQKQKADLKKIRQELEAPERLENAAKIILKDLIS